MRRNITKEMLEKGIKESLSMRSATKLLGLPYNTFIRHAKKHGIYYPNQGLMGGTKKTSLKISLEEILNGMYPNYHPGNLKRRILKAGILKNECSECGQNTKWNEKPLKLQLDHIDGNPYNHKKENLRILCPNCHSQTGTFSGRGRKKKVTDEELIKTLQNTSSIYKALQTVGLSTTSTNYERAKELKLKCRTMEIDSPVCLRNK